jgi:hypothetical protein
MDKKPFGWTDEEHATAQRSRSAASVASPVESLGQIVMDMHRLEIAQLHSLDAYDLKDIAAAVRTLAESVIALHAPTSDPDVTGSGIRTVRAAQSPADVQRQHLAEFGK